MFIFGKINKKFFSVSSFLLFFLLFVFFIPLQFQLSSILNCKDLCSLLGRLPKTRQSLILERNLFYISSEMSVVWPPRGNLPRVNMNLNMYFICQYCDISYLSTCLCHIHITVLHRHQSWWFIIWRYLKCICGYACIFISLWCGIMYEVMCALYCVCCLYLLRNCFGYVTALLCVSVHMLFWYPLGTPGVYS